MHLNKKRAKIIKNAVKTWHDENIIDDETTQKLNDSIHIVSFDWKKASFWSFCFAVFCFVIALLSFFETELFFKIIELFALFCSHDIVRFIISALLSSLFYYLGFYFRKKEPLRIYRNEALLCIAAALNAWAILEFGILISYNSGHFSLLLLLACIIYGVIGYLNKANSIWLFALISFVSWLGTETAYLSDWGAYFFGMNYPLRFALFGTIMTAISVALRQNPKFSQFFSITLSTSLFCLFTALWLLSIFGNCNENSWYDVKQSELFHWSLLFALAAFISLYLGFKLDIHMLRSYGVIFLFINLYTRFFEYFWDAIDKSIFFALLGLSLWFIAHKAEKIWLNTEKHFGKIIDKEY